MKWYGKSNFFKFEKNSFKNTNLKLKKKYKKYFFKKNNNFSLRKFQNFLYLPYNWNFVIFENKKYNILNFYIYNSDYFFILPFMKKFLSLKYDDVSNVVVLNFFFKNNYYSIFWNYFKLIFFSFSKIFFRKLRFKGKGYYIYKNSRNTIALQFGYSHKFYLYSFFTAVKFITKTIILMFGVNYRDLLNKSYSLFNIKPINIFTGKGIRFARQIIYRKTGKVSSYR